MSFAPALFRVHSVCALWPPPFRLSFFLSSSCYLSSGRSHALISSLFHSFIFPVFSIVLINFLLYLYSYLVPFPTYPFFVFREMVMVIIVNVFRFVFFVAFFFSFRLLLSVSFSLSFIHFFWFSIFLLFYSHILMLLTFWFTYHFYFFFFFIFVLFCFCEWRVYSCVTEHDFLVGCDSGFVFVLIQNQLSTLEHTIFSCSFTLHFFFFVVFRFIPFNLLVCSVVARMLNCFLFFFVVYLLRFFSPSFVYCMLHFLHLILLSNLFYIHFLLISFSLYSIAFSFGALFIPLSSYLKMQNINK